jgi:hypothetical protein
LHGRGAVYHREKPSAHVSGGIDRLDEGTDTPEEVADTVEEVSNGLEE